MPNIRNLKRSAHLLKLALVAEICFFVLMPLFTLEAISDEERLARRVQAHLTVRDPAAAVDEAQRALIAFPHSASLHEGWIRSLARLGDEKRLLEAWKSYTQLFPDQASNRELIEEMAWGVLNKASASSSLVMRQMTLLAAFFSREARGVAILCQALHDPNYAIRSVAVKLAAHFRDQKLIDEVRNLYKNEKVWIVREKVLEAIGKMKISSLRSDLEALIASDESQPVEKAAAIAALLELLDTINRSEVEKLTSSNRSGFRQLACQSIAYFHSLRDLDQLLLLAEDSHSGVRFEAFQAIGQLKPLKNSQVIINLARRGSQDPHYQVALSAAWLLTLYEPQEGQKALLHYLEDERREVRALAAAAIGAAGQYGVTLALDQFRTHSDPYVRLNLALGLIGVRQATEETSIYLKNRVLADREKWSTMEAGLFRAIVNKPSKMAEDPVETPEIDNQLLRLELLNLLAILKAPEIGAAIREFLSERSWEISATASILLLTEGDESAIDIVKQHLHDQDPRLRLQSALILSIWSREESAIQALEEGYSERDRETKARILEGLGRIGSMQSVPFLINVLHEPSQTLRVIAAMALIQCLNH